MTRKNLIKFIKFDKILETNEIIWFTERAEQKILIEVNKKEFLISIHDILEEKYFNNSAHQWIIKQILEYHEKFHCPPSMEVLKVELKKVDNEVLQVSIREQLKQAYQSSEEDLAYVEILPARKLNFWA